MSLQILEKPSPVSIKVRVKVREGKFGVLLPTSFIGKKMIVKFNQDQNEATLIENEVGGNLVSYCGETREAANFGKVNYGERWHNFSKDLTTMPLWTTGLWDGRSLIIKDIKMFPSHEKIRARKKKAKEATDVINSLRDAIEQVNALASVTGATLEIKDGKVAGTLYI